MEDMDMKGPSDRFYSLRWTDKKGGYHAEQSINAERLKKKLKTIRCKADLWEVDEYGALTERIGGCEPADGQDDKRIKWNWWYESPRMGN